MTPARAAVLALVLLASASVALAAGRVALVVGNSPVATAAVSVAPSRRPSTCFRPSVSIAPGDHDAARPSFLEEIRHETSTCGHDDLRPVYFGATVCSTAELGRPNECRHLPWVAEQSRRRTRHQIRPQFAKPSVGWKPTCSAFRRFFSQSTWENPGRRLPAGGGGLRRPCTSGGTRPHSTWNSIVTRHVASTSSQEAQQGNSRAAQQGNSRAAEAPPWARGTPRHQHPLSGRASPHLRTARLVQVEARRAKRRHAQGGATSQVKASNTSERPAGRCHGPATFSFAYLVPPPHEYPRRSKTEPFVLSRS